MSPAIDARSFARIRALAREFFPDWSRRARARWVVAKMRTVHPKVPISSLWSHDLRAFRFLRALRELVP